MATNELNELKINVTLDPKIKIVGQIQPTTPIVANVTPGARGKSAYQIWLDEGHTGTEEDFLEWLKVDIPIASQVEVLDTDNYYITTNVETILKEVYELIQLNKDKNYIHIQGVSSNIWIIDHNLGKRPSTKVFDTFNNEVIGSTIYNSDNQLTLIFSGAFSGTAYLN